MIFTGMFAHAWYLTPITTNTTTITSTMNYSTSLDAKLKHVKINGFDITANTISGKITDGRK